MNRRKNGENISDDESFIIVQDDGDNENDETAPTINWDIDPENPDDVVMDTSSNINWDIEVDDVPMGDAIEISWDIDTTEIDENNEKEVKYDPWEIEVEDGGIDKIDETVQIKQENTNELILESSDTRNEFLDEILEVCSRFLKCLQITKKKFFLLKLQTFLKQRLIELNLKDNLVLSSILQKAPKEISELSVDNVKGMLESVENILKLLHDSRFRMIIEIKASTRYTERLVNDLNKKLETASRMDVLGAEALSKQQDVEENIVRLQLQKVTLVKEANYIKDHLQESIAKTLGRPVNIMGDIHTILAV